MVVKVEIEIRGLHEVDHFLARDLDSCIQTMAMGVGQEIKFWLRKYPARVYGVRMRFVTKKQRS
jgi:hypothetical protein